MIIDSRSATETGEYDVVIVGAGPAGITLANEFDGSGLRVALLESGGEEFDPDTQALYDGTVTGLDEIDLTACRLRMLGGTSNHWGGRCVPLDPIDFARAPFSGLTGWPFPREELAPYYPRANSYCGVGSFDYDPEKATGLKPDDLLMPADSIVEAAVVRQSSVNFGEAYLGMLTGSKNVALWLWANLTGLAFDAEGAVESVTTRTLSGQERVFRAPHVILACGAVENARILMLANRDNGTSYGDAGGLLGAGYMDHPAGGAAFLHPSDRLGDNPHWDKDLAATDGMILRGGRNGAPVEKVLLKYETEQQPTRDNRVTLGDEVDAFGRPLPILHWAPGAFDRDSLMRTTLLIGTACGQAGLGRFEMEPYFDEPYFDATTAWRQFGARDRLLAALEIDCPTTRLGAIRATARADFETGDVVVADRWIMSRTECLIAALCQAEAQA